MFYRVTPEGLLVFLRVTPNAGRNAVDGVEIRDDNTTVLRLRVTAVPDKGKANAAALTLLAKTLGVAKSSLTLVGGETARFKTVRISGESQVLVTAIEQLDLRRLSS